IGGRAVLLPGAEIGADAQVLPGACVASTVPAGQHWGGSPVRPVHEPDVFDPPAAPARSWRWHLAYQLGSLINGLLLVAAAVPDVMLATKVLPHGVTLRTACLALAPWMPLMTVMELAGYALLLAAVVRLAGKALRPGIHSVHSRTAWSAWLVYRLVENARHTLFPLYASLFTSVWLRLLGARIGKRTELSTVVTLPTLLRAGSGAFVADDVLAAPYELCGGWLRLGISEVGNRAFVGNSGIVGPGKTVTDGALVGVLSGTPMNVPKDSSWLGLPAMRLPRTPQCHDLARTFEPPRRLVALRAAVELTRLVPLVLGGLLALSVTEAILLLWNLGGPWLTMLLVGPVLYLAGWIAAGLTTVAKWFLVGKFTPSEHPLWSGFVWRNELYATFVGVLAEPWFVPGAIGTPTLIWWLRSLGSRIGRSVWCETHWLPEPDLVEIGAGATVDRGCVLQTHLFHDRVMRLDRVRLDRDATIGPHSIALPGSSIGHGTNLGAGSLVMAAETVPPNSVWYGNPITPRLDDNS
ncbi:MAG: amino acid adenylation protein, partial [Kutzneria sp.]|nr:amino acid adenylation protein [Kutzneria sp.]